MKPAHMKYLMPILAGACLMALAQATPLYATPPTGPQIRVRGESQLTTAPDHAVVTIRMENRAHSPKVAGELHKKILGNTLKTLKDLSIPETDVETAGPYMETANTMASTLSITIRDLDQLSPLAQAVSNKPNTTVETIAYSHTRLDELMEQNQTQALLNAKSKALSMTQTLEIPLGKTIYIQETDATLSTNPAGPGTPGIRIKNKIEVIFRLGNGND